MNTFSKWEDVPMFDSETAEADFWMENRPDLRLMESAIAASSENSESVTINLRFDPRMLARIKRLARSRYLNYQSMIKQWLSERMEQELREATPKLMKTDLPNRKNAAFTLIELLLVITIIALLAGLVVGAMIIAKPKAMRASAEAQRDALITAIERYKKDRGVYPPDNAVNGQNYDSVLNSLFYELTGCSNTLAGLINRETQEKVDPNALAAMNVGGVINGLDPATQRDYYTGLKAAQHSIVTNGGNYKFSVFGILSKGPLMLDGGDPILGRPINPFHYNSSSPTNNPGSFDLWIDVLWSGNTNRVCNWGETKPL